MQQPREYIQAFVDAAAKEYAAFMSWKSIKPLSEKACREIFNNPKLRRRILKSRAAYRDKNRGTSSTLAAKCRVVALGFGDPELAQIPRNSPTGTRAGFMLVVQFAASGFNDPRGRWIFATADASNAFLQGVQVGRTNPLYLRPPTDPILKAAGAFTESQLYEVVGNIYGLANAPYLWSTKVRKQMYALQFVSHSLDVMLFIHYDSAERVDAVALFHVDDMLLAASPTYDLTDLQNAISWGKFTFAPDLLTFTGKQLAQQANGSILIHQAEYIGTLEHHRLPTGRLQQDPALTPTERSLYLSVGGSLQWLCTNTRWELAAGTSLSQRGSPTVDDLKAMFRLIAHAQETPFHGIVVKPLPLSKDKLLIAAYGDSSWANAEGYKSQAGSLVCLTTREALDGQAEATPLEGHSNRSQRVLRSTLAAEAHAADTAIDMALYYAYLFTEVLVGRRSFELDPDDLIEVAAITDCRSLYDAVQQMTPSLTEKRTIVDIQAIKHALRNGSLRWVPTDQQRADGMTKLDFNLVASLAEFLRDARVTLRDTEAAAAFT